MSAVEEGARMAKVRNLTTIREEEQTNAHILKHIEACIPTFAKAYVEVVGISMGIILCA